MAPNFRREIGVEAFIFWLSLPHFAVRWRRMACGLNLSCAISHERGGLSRAEGRLWYALLSSSSDREEVDYHGET